MSSASGCIPGSSAGQSNGAVDVGAALEDVTVVVVSYNSARHLPALARALRSGTSVPARILVVDNASTDDSVACATAAGFEVCPRESNDGFGAACNAGLELASTEFVLFCNPDVRPSPDALRRLVIGLETHPDAGVAGIAFDAPFRARRFSSVSGSLWSFLPSWLGRLLSRFDTEVNVEPSAKHVVVDYVVGAFLLCRASAVRAIGGFDERFFLYSEEEDLCRRLWRQGWATLLVSRAMVTHEHSTSSEGVDGTRMAPFRFHSLYWYFRKHHARPYAEFARIAISTFIVIDRGYRALLRRPQAHGGGAAMAAFRNIATVRSRWQRR